MKKLAAIAVAFLVTGCVHAGIIDHAADSSFTGSIQRTLVIGTVDRQWSMDAPGAFNSALTQDLSECGVVVRSFVPPPLELNELAKIHALIADFKPDSVLLIRQASRTLQGGGVLGGTYVATLLNPQLKREIWKAHLDLEGSPYADSNHRDGAATNLARDIVRQMTQDGVLKSCPPPHQQTH